MSWPNTPIRAPLSSGQTGALRGGGPSEKQEVKRLRQVIGADLISVAGHSLWLHQTPIEDQCSRTLLCGKQWPPQGPRPRNSSVPSCRSTQYQRGGSADPPRECQTRGRGSHRTLGVGSPSRGARETVQSIGAAPGLSSRCSRTGRAVDIRKEHHAGSPLWWPVRPWALSLSSAVTRQQSE